MQHDYLHDTAGQPGGGPRWLRLTRAGDTITGDESADGEHWTNVGTANLAGLPETVQVGLFATSPGDLTLRPTGLGASATQTRFTQATGVFDNVKVDGARAAAWSSDIIGGMGNTDWEKYHRAPGLVDSNGTLTVTGSGDIGPVGTVGGHAVEDTLVGLAIGLIIVILLAVRFMTGRFVAAKAVVVGAVGFVTGLVAAGVVVPVGVSVLRANGSVVLPVPVWTQVRLVLGVAAFVAVTAIFALALRALLRRAWLAVLVAISAVVIPYALAVLPLLPDEVANWLLRVTPAAGFAVQQTISEFPQVVAHYAPSEGYFPLPGWAGFAVLCAYTAVALRLSTSE
jgi:hypothetical protein